MMAEDVYKRALARPALDWDAARLLLAISPTRLYPARTASVETIRSAWRMFVEACARSSPLDREAEVWIGEGRRRRKARIFRPKPPSDVPAPALIWYHGGGFVSGDLDTAAPTCRALAVRSGCTVVAPVYRLAPENSIQMARDDCVDAFDWVRENAASLEIDPKRILVGGDSAGGALAAMVAGSISGEVRPAGQLLVYPCTDPCANVAHDDGWRSLLSREILTRCRAFVSEKTNLSDRSIAPLRMPNPASLPPTILLTAGFDSLRDQGIAYGARLARSGVAVNHLHYPGQFHGFLSFDRLLPNARDALDRLGTALRQLAGDSAPVSAASEHGRAVPTIFDITSIRQRWDDLLSATLVCRGIADILLREGPFGEGLAT